MADRGRTLTLKLVADVSDAARGIQGVESRLAGFAAWGARIAGIFGVAFSVDRIADFAIEATNMAAATELSVRAVGRVFGEYAAKVEGFAQTSAQAFGVSRREALESATLLGTQLKAYGADAATAADQSITLTQRAAELAATFGGSTYDAINGVSGLLRGEYDTIEKYGVSIKQSDVNARLAAEGLDGLEGPALKAAQAQAVLALFLESTAQWSGAVADNSDTLAVKQQILSARWEDAKVKLGEALMPVLEKLTDWLIAKGIPYFERFTVWLETRGIPALKDLADWLEVHVLPTFAAWARWYDENGEHIHEFWVGFTGPIVLAAKGVEGMVLAFTNLWHAIREVVEWLNKGVDALDRFLKKIPGGGVAKDLLKLASGDPRSWAALVPGFGGGGVVGGALGEPTLAVVHGGERIIPVGAAGAAGGGLTVNVYASPLASPADTGAAAVDAIREYERVAGRSWRSG